MIAFSYSISTGWSGSITFFTYFSFVWHVGPVQYLSLQGWKGRIYRVISVPQRNVLERLDLGVAFVPYSSPPLKTTNPFSPLPHCQDVIFYSDWKLHFKI